MADPEVLKATLGVPQGHVTPLAVMNDAQKAVTVVFDVSMTGKVVNVHPLDNAATISLPYEALVKFVTHFSGKEPIQFDFEFRRSVVLHVKFIQLSWHVQPFGNGLSTD